MEKRANPLGDKLPADSLLFVKELLSATSSIVCILNQNNELVLANSSLMERFGIELDQDLASLRFGEVAGCVNVTVHNNTCGGGERCQYCGANYAFQDFWKSSKTVINECRLVRNNNGLTEQLDLEITASPFNCGEPFMLVSLVDVTDKKRREILERIFFHDIINIAGSLKGVFDLISLNPQEVDPEMLSIGSSLGTQILEEIKAQQQLIKAEKGELNLQIEPIAMGDFLAELKHKVQFSDAAFDRTIEVQDLSGNQQFSTDRTLLTRVVFNMVKNALEAVNRGENVKITARKAGELIRIDVHNDSYIHPDVQAQLFQRSFSTKGANRGLGTYSMKMLGERYLKGQVDFETSSENGTTFYIQIPPSLV
ncbi:HAMP domain-containing sensor histidine kinase [Mangrovibacterium marinum]|uniref:sensor histidine kinase n=1 Tax=Mangrovibacterium marinum TaxID=1639118 RepID=UPI002A18D9AB|nr:HAMP domain-containing sensor histidine kinase [Mangrovibacterium marinum]